MGWFSVFSKKRIDDDILDIYLDIELLIIDIDRVLTAYLHAVSETGYYKTNPKDKRFYSIQNVSHFFNKLKEDYDYCYSLRKDKKHYNFNRYAKTLAKKLEIEVGLGRILSVLKVIYDRANKLDPGQIKENDFSPLVKFIEKFLASEAVFKKIKKEDERLVLKIIEKIVDESDENEKNRIWLINQKDKVSKLYFSYNLSIGEIRYLDLVPLLELEGLDKRSLFINELHKDNVLPVYHYNLEINARNIHVIPKNYKTRVKPYLLSL